MRNRIHALGCECNVCKKLKKKNKKEGRCISSMILAFICLIIAII